MSSNQPLKIVVRIETLKTAIGILIRVCLMILESLYFKQIHRGNC